MKLPWRANRNEGSPPWGPVAWQGPVRFSPDVRPVGEVVATRRATARTAGGLTAHPVEGIDRQGGHHGHPQSEAA